MKGEFETSKGEALFLCSETELKRVSSPRNSKRRRSACEGPINVSEKKKCTSVPRFCNSWLAPPEILNIWPRALGGRFGHARV